MSQDIQLPGEVSADTLSGVPKNVRDWRNIRFKPTDNPATWGSPRVLDFTKFLPGETPDGMKVIGSATTVIDANGRLNVTALWSSTANYVTFPGWTFAEGVFRARIIQGSFMIRFMNGALAGRAVWSTGPNIEIGYLDSAGTPTSLGTPAAMAGVAGNLIWVEVLVGPMFNGSSILARSWVDGTARPTSPQVTGNFGAPVVGIEKNRGFITLSSITGAAKYDRLEFYDGQNGEVQASGQAAFIGRWFPRFNSYKICMCTVRGGDRFRFYVRGTTTVYCRFVDTSGVVSSLVPVADVFVNGARFGGAVTFTSQGAGGGSLMLVNGLDSNATYQVEVRVRGVNEGNDKWLAGAGVMIESLNPGAGFVAPWPDDRPKFLFIGDSITEGIVGRSNSGGSTPTNAAGDESWPVLAAETLGVQAILNGFGGTGLTVIGSGGMPVTATNAFNYMQDRPIDTKAENIKFIAINIGTNDFGASVATASYQAALVALIQGLLLAHASVQAIFVMRPFNGDYATQVAAAVTAVGDNRVFYMDTSSWSTLTFTDGLHPNVAGHVAAAGYFVTAVGTMQSAALT